MELGDGAGWWSHAAELGGGVELWSRVMELVGGAGRLSSGWLRSVIELELELK